MRASAGSKSIIVIGVLLVLLSLIPAASSESQTQGTLGEKYCGHVEKKYGIIGTVSNTTYDFEVRKYYYIKIEGIIDTSTEDYVKYAIERASAEGAGLIILLNTPGGYLDPALNIVVAVNNAPIPVIAYVYGKWAESAGTLILVTSHVAAMKPGTIIGSMQPVMYDPTTGSYQPVNESKIVNPIIKILCEHGATKGRNSSALVRFVLKNDNYGAEEALNKGVIELVANNTEDLLSKLNGKVVALPAGGKAALLYGGGAPEYIPPPPRVVVIHALSDPILSGILLSLGSLILIFSIISGHLAYAAIGVFLLLLGMAGTGYNPNIVSLLLILIGAVLLAIEIHTPGFGIFGGLGIVMLVFGIVLLPTGGGFAVAESYADTILAILYSLGAVAAALTVLVVYKFIQVKRKKPFVWRIIGETGVALDDIPRGGEGFVLVKGEYWKARGLEDIRKKERIIVVDKEGPILIVRKYVDEKPQDET